MSKLNPLFATLLIFGIHSQAAIASPSTRTMVMVDRSTLTAQQSQTLDSLISQLPRTQVGKRCQWYGRPQVWCLLLNAATANQVKTRLVQAGVPAETREVSRIRNRGGRS